MMWPNVGYKNPGQLFSTGPVEKQHRIKENFFPASANFLLCKTRSLLLVPDGIEYHAIRLYPCIQYIHYRFLFFSEFGLWIYGPISHFAPLTRPLPERELADSGTEQSSKNLSRTIIIQEGNVQEEVLTFRLDATEPKK